MHSQRRTVAADFMLLLAIVWNLQKLNFQKETLRMKLNALHKHAQKQGWLQDKLNQNNIKNKFKSGNSIQIKSVQSELKSSPPSTSELNNQNPHLQYSRIRQLVDNFEETGEVIRLAYLTANQEVHIDEETLYFLQKYSTFEIAFIAFAGEKSAGKSFALDTLLNISCAEGNQFTTISGESREKGIYLWTIPFSCNFKRKVFLIQCSGITFDQPHLIREDQILLDLTNILASTLILVHPPDKKKRKNPIFEKDQQMAQLQLNLIEQLRKSSRRVINGNQSACKQDPYWAQVVYSLYHSKPPTGAASSYEECYSHCSLLQLPLAFLHEDLSRQEHIQALNSKLAGISPLFTCRLNELLLEAVDRTSSKQYLNLKYTGNICCKLLINSVKYLNKKPNIKINKIFASILKELYHSSYTYHTDLYDDYLQQYFSKEEALSFDDLIEAFRVSSTYALDSFNEIIIEEQLHRQYEDKLLAYIEEKEGLIMEINSKKTKNALREKIKLIENVKINDIQSVKAFLLNLNRVQHKLDHNKTTLMAEKILKYTRNIEKRIIEQQEKQDREKLAHLKAEKGELEHQYQQIKQENQENRSQNRQNQKNYRGLVKSHTIAEASARALKKQIQAEKRYQKEYIVSKQSKKQYAEGLLDVVRELQQKMRENKKMMEEIRKDYEYHPEILQLQKKIEEKDRQIRQLQRIESRIDLQSRNSIFSKNSVLKSNPSAIRSAIQKPKDPKVQPRQIKKLTKK